MKFPILSAFLFVCLSSCMHSGKMTQTSKTNLPTTRIIAHRGAWKTLGLPENSIAALRAAIAMQCYGSEMDVHMTADSFLVVNHNPHYHGLDIQNSTLESLRAFKLSNGEPLPLLSDFLSVIAGQNSTKLVLELKPSVRGAEWARSTVMKVVREVQKFHALPQTVFIGFDFEMCREIARLVPGSAIEYLNGDRSPQQVKDAGLTGMDYHFSVYQRNPDYFSEAKAIGLSTNAWTVDDAVQMDWLFAMGVDFITTDDPAIGFETLKRSPSARGWKLAWSDEFLKSGLPDSANWAYNIGGHGWGNNEKQFYTESNPENAFVKNGLLHIVAKKEKKENNDYTSARLVTKNKHSWRYGRIEARLKLPPGVGLWPAFWMLGDNIDQKGWPQCGEIDIMEYVGYMPDKILGTIHTEAYNHGKGTQKGGETPLDHPTDDFHVYAIEWNERKISFYLDDRQFFEFSNERKTTAEWPFDQPFFIILNMAVGGNLGGAKGIDESAFPATYLIDYVRVWEK